MKTLLIAGCVVLALAGSAHAQSLPDRFTGDWCVGESITDNQWTFVRATPAAKAKSVDCAYAGVVHITRAKEYSEDFLCEFHKVVPITSSKVNVDGWCSEIEEKHKPFKWTMQLIGDKLFVRER